MVVVSGGKWVPLLNGKDAVAAMEFVHQTATSCLISDYTIDSGSDLAFGQAGIALLFGYLDLAEPKCGWGAHAETFICRSIEGLATKPHDSLLFTGYSGIAWATDHLRLQVFSAGSEDPNGEIDKALISLLSCSSWQNNYDLIWGLVGYGVYALNRLSTPGGQEVLSLVIQHLDELKILQKNGYTWYSDPRYLPQWLQEECPNGYYDLGIAHGVPGVAALLGLACAAGVAKSLASSLLEGAMAWLLAQKQVELSYCYDTVVPGIDGLPKWPGCRIAWCVGDLSTATGLAVAAKGASRIDWWLEAVHTARKAAMRTYDESGVVDAFFCHGAAGNGHLFNRFYQASGEAVFAEAARSWYNRAIEMSRNKVSIGNKFQSTKPEFLKGDVGIALALLSAVHPVEPAWDNFLLASIPIRD